MAGTHGVPDVASGLTAEQLLELLQSQDKLAGILNQIKDERGKANAAIALVGPANEILTLRDQAKQAQANANQAWNDAQAAKDKATVDADTVRIAARKQAEEIVAAAKAEASGLRAEAQRLNDTAQETHRRAQARMADIMAREKDIDARELTIVARENAADGVRRTFEEKHKHLSAVLANLA